MNYLGQFIVDVTKTQLKMCLGGHKYFSEVRTTTYFQQYVDKNGICLKYIVKYQSHA